MRSIFIFLLVLLSAFFLIATFFHSKKSFISPLGKKVIEKPLDKYTFENLRKRNFSSSTITLGKKISEASFHSSYIFYFDVMDKKVSGLANIPVKNEKLPVIILLRGFVDKEIYAPGIGSQRIGEYLAARGFITFAPDFLGFGESDNPSINSIEERFQTYETALTLLSSLQNTIELGSSSAKIDTKKVGIWGHSNGGHISLSLLSITGKSFPTVLWNPVSKPFPYSVLYFTDEFEDNGKQLRKAIANFEEYYDIEKYSPPNYYDFINAPIQIHQGTADEAVPLRWSNQLVEILTAKKKKIDYFTYDFEDHNFSKGSWPTVALRTFLFFEEKFSGL